MKQAILDIIDREIELDGGEREDWYSDPFTKLRELRSEIENIDSPLIPELDNFYEFSEGGEVWIKGRFMRYAYRSNEGGILSARYIRNLPPHPSSHDNN